MRHQSILIKPCKNLYLRDTEVDKNINSLFPIETIFKSYVFFKIR